ncbi:hypothetical protein [Actinopolyspora alba]|uniref:hypothetical protein n=1 Tax=Actinopolyspora alba TaxID=673379 RepID=UPI001587095A|nr:hypothetical protein [Actinopolyspora alba]
MTRPPPRPEVSSLFGQEPDFAPTPSPAREGADRDLAWTVTGYLAERIELRERRND